MSGKGGARLLLDGDKLKAQGLNARLQRFHSKKVHMLMHLDNQRRKNPPQISPGKQAKEIDDHQG